MNRVTAQLILSAYRPDGSDAADPVFAEALVRSRRDPELRAWLDRQNRFDRRIADALRTIPVPSPLRAAILAGARVSVRERRSWWWRFNLPLAACVALGFGAQAAWQHLHPAAPTTLAEAAERLERQPVSLGLMSSEFTQIATWLGRHSAPTPANLPSALRHLMLFGCQQWDTPQGKVSLICFVTDERRAVHLYVFASPDTFGKLPPSESPRAETYAATTLMLWRDAEHAYALGPFADAESGRRLLNMPF